jgi:ribonucleoside-triphosphate reductase
MSTKRKDVARAYVTYRNQRTLARENTIDKTVDEIVDSSNDYWLHENSNKNPYLSTTQRDYIAGAVSSDASRRRLLPPDIIKAHDEGIIHFHDMDYFLQPIYNCCLINLEDMLQNGTVISGTQIDKPHKFSTACNIATQIIAQVASSQYGGQSISLAHLSPFVQATREKFKNDFPFLNDEQIEEMVKKDITAGVQTLQYQIITLMTTNGQAPFITVYMNLIEVEDGSQREDLAMVIEEVLNQRIQGVKNEKGVYITPAFPKLIYALDEINIHSDSKYYYLTQLSAKCTAKRMVPDYISNKVQKELKENNVYPCMGCRSFLTVDRTKQNYAKAKNYVEGKKYYGRFNQGVVTINLADAALSSKKNFDDFWEILDERLELCHKALQYRHKRLLGTTSNIAPILWQNGAIARLDKDEPIDELLKHGYSTISLGYCALYECTKYMTGYSHTDDRAKDFALSVLQRLNDKCTEWKNAEDIDYSVYGTPLESTTYKFAKCLQKRFGIIEGITDRDYVTNSYHVNVREEIDAFTKLGFESEFQKLSPGGAISYIEVPNMQHNLEAVLDVIKYIYDNIMYAEINTKSDYCQVCGFDGEILINKDGQKDKLYWKCPQCGNTDTNKMNVARRTCGYIGTNFWNQGRTQEIAERVLHL